MSCSGLSTRKYCHTWGPDVLSRCAENVRLQGVRDMPTQKTGSIAVRKAAPHELVKPPKVPLNMRVDVRVLEWFKGHGDGYQARINAVLLDYVRRHGGA